MHTDALTPAAIPTTAEALVADFLRRRAASTHRAYSDCLRAYARWRKAAGPAEAAQELLAAGPRGANWMAAQYRDDLVAAGLAPATVNLRLTALRALVTLARRVGMVAWALEVDGVRARTYRDTRGPGVEGVQRVLDATHPADRPERPSDLRDRAIIRLLNDLALRRGEIASLDAEHVDLRGRRLAVLGKGTAEREWLALPAPTAEALAAWVIARGARAGPLFTRGRGARLSGQGIWRIVKRLGAAAGVENVRPHGFRHTAITAALDATGGDVRSVARFSRHADVRTLQRYDDARGTAAVAALVAGAVA